MPSGCMSSRPLRSLMSGPGNALVFQSCADCFALSASGPGVALASAGAYVVGYADTTLSIPLVTIRQGPQDVCPRSQVPNAKNCNDETSRVDLDGHPRCLSPWLTSERSRCRDAKRQAILRESTRFLRSRRGAWAARYAPVCCDGRRRRGLFHRG